MRERPPTIAIGLDAAERTLIDRLCNAGRLATLASLRARGRYAVVRSEAKYFMSAVWPTFYSSLPSGHHGWYYGKMWRPERMLLEYGDESWLSPRPFWELLPPGRTAAVMDVPYVARSPRDFDGFFVSGWQTHDQLGRVSAPEDAWDELRRRFDAPAMRAERFGAQTTTSLLDLRREVLAGLEQTARIGRWLLESRHPDLLLLVFGGVHRASHYLWDLSQIDGRGLDPDTRRLLEGARIEVYEAADRAIGDILAAAPGDANVLVFALHGMAENGGWAERFRAMVDAIRLDGLAPTAGSGGSLLSRVRRRLPSRIARQLTRRVPFEVNRRLLPLWSAGMHDWSRTRFFALPCDVNGFLRINRRGREAGGVVEPGGEYGALLDDLVGALGSFRGLETDRPVVRDAARTDRLEAARGPKRDVLPDLIVRWEEGSSAELSGVVSPRYGEVRWERGAPFPSGRSGNHLPDGWAIAAGPDIETGVDVTCDTMDLVPTLFRWLGADPDPGFHGRPVPELGG